MVVCNGDTIAGEADAIDDSGGGSSSGGGSVDGGDGDGGHGSIGGVGSACGVGGDGGIGSVGGEAVIGLSQRSASVAESRGSPSRYDLDDPMQFDQVLTSTSGKSSRYLSDSWNRLSSFARLLHLPRLSAKPTQSHLTSKKPFQSPTNTKERDVPKKVFRRLKKSGRPAPVGA
ncbi:keratin, type II cytoskeletal 1-like [Octopus bimaculoides]|uniref:keratin, type II cytoskeletal 1-like n=1 Tax=Octopus bimaculoides TaxID=37653 RepID=UPI00071D47EA|nr:keratin, type II cytoskeletal 1-like [Octopus bimaculoides]|eukprot:XP_014789498.1 PREDICTED: keratin, type II cytoskeletal 1-like [Octopus bimaculoides]